MTEGTPTQTSACRDVFVSYASQDASVANAIVEALEKRGIKCWIAPRDVRPGTVYADAIVGAINESTALVLVLSANAMPSPHVGREVERAASKRKQLIAFRVDTTPLSRELEYFLSNSQWIDVPKLGVPAALTVLAEAVRQGSSASPQAVSVGSSIGGGSKRKIATVAAIVGVGIAGAVGLHLWLLQHRNAQPPAGAGSATSAAAVAISDKSIAVLPFADMSEKHDQEYFGDGMAEEILDLLAKVPGLHVPARTSSFYFKGKSEDIPTIARRLMVANVLEGSVRKSGNHVRVTVQLVRADNGYHLWSETYDRTLDDLFRVQDEIAGEVVKALKVSMGADATPRAVPTNNAEAHRLLLQAQFWLDRGTADDNKKAATYYQQAIDTDPKFAEAWAGLAQARLFGGLASGQDWHQVRGSALPAAERAVALGPKLAQAHYALGAVRYYEWDWVAAHTQFDMARSLDPDNSDALTSAGSLEAVHGHLADALRLWDQAAARDPLNYAAYGNLSLAYYALGQFKESLVAMQKSVELASIEGSHSGLAQILLAVGKTNEALAEVEKEQDPGYRAYGLARIDIVIGRKGDADVALAALEKNFAAEQVYNIATLYALRGDRDSAFVWLERAYEQHDPLLIEFLPVTIDPDMGNLHDDPRWAAFLRKMNLP